MKIFTVMQAPRSDSDDASIHLIDERDPVVCDDEGDAINVAKSLARDHPGRHFWIVEGQAVRSYRCEPLPVVESVPVVTVVPE